MNIALLLLLLVLTISLAISGILVAVYLRVTRKRREFIAVLGGTGRAVPRFKHILISTYAASTIVWSLGLIVYFFQIS